MEKGNLQQVENEGSYRGVSYVQARRIARFVQHSHTC